ncbi:BAG family molecular chaperone regulator 3-like [Mizuhopecten yessoensis]|uniref:BAG family molecular chaperone regulator 4 n=1 Tax=Mizuhopecten yessoensis TaxID=6573 RepID=A0A210PX21_MIZYE|nr:BAG family molecular chaperone regulator 3-like [Mizuhopecten yessoensis]OWF41015.1 BAG family molecular chaperone regulator 4 [Mizuhopecten yessoensis]
MASRQMYPNPYTPQQPNNSDLPPGWEMILDKMTGWPYFIDHNTRQTSWEDPRIRMGQRQPQPPSYGGGLRELPIKHENSGMPQQYSQMPQPYPQQQYPQQPYSQQQPFPPQQPWQNPSSTLSDVHMATPPRTSTPPRVGTPPRHSGNFNTQQGRSSPVVREIPIHHISSTGNRGQQPETSTQGPNSDLGGYTIYTGVSGGPQQAPTSSQNYQQGPTSQASGQPQPFSQPPQQPYPQQQSYQSPPQPSYQQPMQQGFPPPPHSQQPTAPQAFPQPPPMSQGDGRGPAERVIPIHHQSQGHNQQQPHYEGTPHPRQQIPQPDYPNSVPSAPPSQYHAGPTVSQSNTTSSLPQHHADPTVSQSESGRKGSTDSLNGQSGGHGQPEKPKPKTPMDIISDIVSEVRHYEAKVADFRGLKTDKGYKYLEEMLTRNLLKLDGIESGSNNDIRQARKNAVREIQASLDQLELKAFSAEQSVDSSQNSASEQSGSASNNNKQPLNISHISVSSTEDKANPTKVKEMVLDSEINC